MFLRKVNEKMVDPVLVQKVDDTIQQLAEKPNRIEVDTKVAQIVSGTPKGTYATVVALQNAFPTGTTGVYIVATGATAGHWYYWNGSAWTDGGVYQSAGISKKAIGVGEIKDTLYSEFVGAKVDVTQASTIEKSVQLQYVVNVSGKTLNGINISTDYDVYSDSSNIDYGRAAIFASSSSTSYAATGFSTMTLPIVDMPKVSEIMHYSDSQVSTLSNNTYLHVLVRVSLINSTLPTQLYAGNLKVSIGGEQLTLEYKGLLSNGSPIATATQVNHIDHQLVTHLQLKEELAVVESNIVGNIKNDYQSGYIYFTVQVNQNFANNDGITTATQDSETMANVYCALKLPTSYNANAKPTQLVMYAHGAGGQITANNAEELSDADVLVNAGYAVFDVNGSHNNYVDNSDHMGSPRAVQAYKKAYEWIKENYNVEERILVHGHSMGGLLALNFTVANLGIVKALGLYHPVTDLYNQAFLKPWFTTTKERMAIEYNFVDQTGATYESDKVVGYNPINNNAVYITAESKRFINLPIPLKIWHGNADTAVLLSGSQSFVQAVKNGGGKAYLRVIDGLGHAYVPAMHQEQLLWFNRWK